MNEQKIRRFISLAQSDNQLDYHDKKEFHKLGKQYGRFLADKLGLDPVQYDVRSCLGGPAVSGEVILHCDWVYVDFSQTYLGVLWRKCDSRKDYTGYGNRWMHYNHLVNVDKVAAELNSVRPLTYA